MTVDPPFITGCDDDGLAPVVLLDLDGVVWLAHQAIPGSVEAIASLRVTGHRVLFVTNNSASTVEQQQTALAAVGIPAVGDVLTSAMAAAQLIEPGERVLVCGGAGVMQAVAARGGLPVRVDDPAVFGDGRGGHFDAVMVGLHRDFDYEGLQRGAEAIRAGARLIGTNDDATYPTPDGQVPGGGAILAAFVVASGAVPQVAGKPYAPMADLVRNVVGPERARAALMVGDRPETDGLFAATLGCRFALVWSGVTAPGADVSPTPDIAVADLAAVAAHLRGQRS
jgi:4-nitrophenyl phosphatase